MTARVFVDTNILVYSRDSSEPEKQETALEWLSMLWEKRNGRVSYQCLNEFYATVTQRLKPGLSKKDARADIKNLLSWNPATVDKLVIENAWHIQDQYGLSWWDSLILSAAQKQNCKILLSEDLQHEQMVEKVKIINPFIADIKML